MPVSRVTKKGQITLPKKIREVLGVGAADRVAFEIDKGGTEVRLKKTPSIMELAGKHEAPDGKTALKARTYMEEQYERM